MGPSVGAPEGDVLDSSRFGCEPQGHFEAIGIAEDCSGRPLVLVYGGGCERAALSEEFVREPDAEAPPVVLAHLGRGVRAGGPVAEPGDVHGPHVESWIAAGHPVGEREAHAAALDRPAITAHADQNPGKPRIGPTRGFPSGAKVKGPLTTRAMPTSASTGKCLNAVSSEGAMRSRSGVSRRLSKSTASAGAARRLQPARRCPRAGPVLPVGYRSRRRNRSSHQLFARSLVVSDDLRDGLGDHVSVLHGEHRQFEAHHASDLARPQASGVDDVRRLDPVVTAVGIGRHRCAGEIAAGGVVQPDPPGAISGAFDAPSPRVSANFCSR